jgi:uncharacterized protein YkwD
MIWSTNKFSMKRIIHHLTWNTGLDLRYLFQRSDAQFTEDLIRRHNEYRQKHGAQPLKHAPDLSAQAQKWAEVLAQSTTLRHSNASVRGERVGENIAMKWSSDPQDSYTGN